LDFLLIAIATGLLPRWLSAIRVRLSKLHCNILGGKKKDDAGLQSYSHPYGSSYHEDHFFQNFLQFAPTRSCVELGFQGICKQLKSLKDDILVPQDGTIRAGRFLGLMGSSGAGKCELQTFRSKTTFSFYGR
jgi:hypothetical protein